MVRKTWYVAAHAGDLRPGGVIGQTILGALVMVARREDGSVFALEDRCPHHPAPLPLGIPVDGNIQCGNHGALFDGDGWCIAVPGQPTAPAGTMRSSKIIERLGCLWVWPGDRAYADDGASLLQFVENGVPPWTLRIGATARILHGRGRSNDQLRPEISCCPTR